MKLFSTFLLIFIVVFSSCDGRARANKTTEQKQSNLSDSFFLQEKYIPELYSEVIVDTTINNNTKVHIKCYTDMSNNILNDFKIDSIHYKYFYRELIGDLKVTKGGKTIFNKTINKSYFNNSENEFFWNKALMTGLYLDDTKTTNEHLYFNVSYCMIESEICKDYNLIIDNKGILTIKELPTEEIH